MIKQNTCKCCGNTLYDSRYFLLQMLGIELRYSFHMDEDWKKKLDEMVKEHKLKDEEYLFVIGEGMK